ncbi:MAG: SAM-dependent methyltransferase [Thiotrichales bacterium]|nr:MAG: SAM-dependent methyltransferase [Thiotrichales bacterium]
MSRSIEALPEPDEVAKQRSRELSSHIAERCAEKGGMISFSEYMQIALYLPGLGYYSGGAQKFGMAGDFITAPEVSALFSRCVARQTAQIIAEMDRADILEFGAGSGVMAADILLELECLGELPANYFIVELSAELRVRQRQTIEAKAAHLLEKVHWLDGLPAQSIQGVVIANEVLDAMPVECFRINNGAVEQLCVFAEAGQMQARYRKAEKNVVDQVRLIEQRRQKPFENGYCSEFNPAIRAWLSSLESVLNKGVVLLIDYGYPVQEYYLDERDSGTLICHYQHRAHADPLWYPGLQDITAFVDFSSVAHAAVEAGFEVSGYTSQAMFLMGCGLAELHQALASDDPGRQILLAQQIKTLTLPSEMGERFKAMALSRRVDIPMIGFSMQDYRNRL